LRLYHKTAATDDERNMLGAVHKRRPHKNDSLVRTDSAPLVGADTLNFKKLEVFFAPKSLGVRIRINPLLLVRKISAPHSPLTADVFYGQPLIPFKK